MPIASKHVCILMGVKNGERFLGEQLRSIQEQTHRDWSMVASDDGSSDRSIEVLQTFARGCTSPVVVFSGPREGFAENFMSLARNKELRADYFAFSDQDDIWSADKLERSLRWLESISPEIPAIYCSRAELVDREGRHIGFSPLFKRPPSFRHALVQNIASGNTMVFNRSAKHLLETTPSLKVNSHDWWGYQIVTGAGGVVFYDPVPTIKYRQHGDNAVGLETTLRSRWGRIRAIFSGGLSALTDSNIKALQASRSHLTNASQKVLDDFSAARNARFASRLYGLWKSGVYRQTLPATCTLWFAAIARKL